MIDSLFMFEDDDDDNHIIDLTFVKKAEDEHPRYICTLCPPPDSVLFEVTDPKMLEFVGAGVHRYMCGRCGWLVDDISPDIRRQERVGTVVGGQVKPIGPIIEAVNADHKDKLRGTAHARVEEITFDLDPYDLDDLIHSGFQLKREETRSSVSGQRHVKEGDKPKVKRR